MSEPRSEMHEPIQRAIQQRDHALTIAMKRKEEFLGARVPKELRNRVIERANELGIPVSILIRNILEEAFADSQSGDSKPFTDVVGWESIRLQKTVACNECDEKLEKGASAYYGLGAKQTTVLCPRCFEKQ